MATIVLVSCVSKKMKTDKPVAAKNLYQSALFKKSLAYAQKLKPEKIFILSALHKVLELDTPVLCYNKTLLDMKAQDRKAWAEEVLMLLNEKCDLQNDIFVLLAGKVYYEGLIKGNGTLRLVNFSLPLKGLPIGKRLAKLSELVK